MKWMRWGFAGGVLLSGVGALLYAALWIALPSDKRLVVAAPAEPGLAAAERQGRRRVRAPGARDIGTWFAVAAVAVGTAGIVGVVTGTGWLLWPTTVAGLGLALLWRQTDAAEEDRADAGRLRPLAALVGRGGPAAWARLTAGAVLLPASLVMLAVGTGGLSEVRAVVLAGLLGVVGVALVVGPGVMRLAEDYTRERAERISSQERADVAAHLHDSVLQTLALIQRNADDPAAVARLARAQERDLRGWLFRPDEPASAGPATAAEQTLDVALTAAAADVEETHGVPVEVVIVGDAAGVAGSAAAPLLGAAREAMANGARHAGAPRIDVYAEIGSDAVEVFVRDRGRGFDPAAVPADRGGLRLSVVDRMERAGGEAVVRSEPGSGTEVRLRLPRSLPANGARP